MQTNRVSTQQHRSGRRIKKYEIPAELTDLQNVLFPFGLYTYNS